MPRSAESPASSSSRRRAADSSDLKVKRQNRNGLIRLVIMFGTIPVAFVVGSLAHSVNAFIVVMGVGLVVSLISRTFLP